MYIKVLLPLFCLVSTATLGQISNDLLSQLPDSLRPVNPKELTYEESKNVIMATRLLLLKSTQNYQEVDRLCGKIGPTYKSFSSKEDKLKHVEFVIRYWLNGVTQSSAADSSRKYIKIYHNLIGNDTDKYDSELANYFFFNGMTSIEERLYPQAYTSLVQAIRIYKRKKNYRFVVYTFGLLSYMYRELALYKMAINSSDSSLFYIKVWEDETRIDPQLLQLATSTMLSGKVRTYCNLFEETGKRSDADSTLRLAHVLRNSAHKNLKSESYEIIARVLYRQMNYSGCVAYADSSLLNCCSSYSSLYATNIRIYKGLSMLKLGNKSDGMLLIKQNPIHGGGAEAARLATELYKYEKASGNLVDALYYHEKLLDFQNYSKFSKNLSQIIDIQKNSENLANSLHIQKLQNKEKQNKEIAGTILMLFSFAVVVLVIRYRNNQNKNRHLLDQIEELTELQILRIEDEKEKERKRLGQELHDELSGTIAASVRYIRMKAEDESGSGNNAWLSEISDLLEKGYDKARGKSHELFLEEASENFWKRLTDNIDLFFAGTNVKMTFSRDKIGSFLNPQIKTTLLVVIKEAITNVIKHSEASEVEILIYEDLGNLILEVCDNGRGMPTGYRYNRKKSIGLLSIEERLNKLKGEMTITARKPTGVTFKVSIPLELRYARQNVLESTT